MDDDIGLRNYFYLRSLSVEDKGGLKLVPKILYDLLFHYFSFANRFYASVCNSKSLEHLPTFVPITFRPLSN